MFKRKKSSNSVETPPGSSKPISSHFKSIFRRQPASAAMMVSPLTLILPLYIYPSPGAWDILYDNITANPHLTFAIVINPDNGPGTTDTPNSDYVDGITKLNSYPNTELYGYVHTLAATRDQALVRSDIETYARWENSTDGNIQLTGIFFDEAPSDFSHNAYNYMSAISDYARSTLYGDNIKTIFNPGVVPDSRYYALTDTVVAFEDYYSNYTSDTMSTIPAENRRKSAILIHHFTGSIEDQQDIVTALSQGGMKGLWVSDEPDYDTFSTKWGDFCSQMASLWSPN